MIDTHCHLTDPRLLEQLPGVLARAREAGVDRMITVATSVADARAAIEVCKENPGVFCAIGIHPNYCHEASMEDVEVLKELQRDARVVALGEMGLDYHYDFAPRDRQRLFFEAQLRCAEETGRVVVIHCREAVEDTLGILRGFGAVRAVFHCFTGSPEEAEAIVGAGHMISFTGAVTFKKADLLREAVRRVPADRVMVETDAPYLSPEPFRSQKVNEPALVVHTAKVVAEAMGISAVALDELTTRNCERFFGLTGV